MMIDDDVCTYVIRSLYLFCRHLFPVKQQHNNGFCCVCEMMKMKKGNSNNVHTMRMMMYFLQY